MVPKDPELFHFSISWLEMRPLPAQTEQGRVGKWLWRPLPRQQSHSSVVSEVTLRIRSRLYWTRFVVLLETTSYPKIAPGRSWVIFLPIPTWLVSKYHRSPEVDAGQALPNGHFH
jgi:hypothetical protein